MNEKFAHCPDPQLHQQGKKSVHSVTDLIKRLLDYRWVFEIELMLASFHFFHLVDGGWL